MFRRFRWLILILCLISFTACSSPATLAPTSAPVAATSAPILIPTNTLPGPAATETPSSVMTATSAVSGAGAKVPNSCDDLVSLITSYIGSVATTKSLGKPQHLSCEFGNADASNIVIVNIGVGGTAANFDALMKTSAQGGRTVTPISGLGVSAFSVTKNNVPAGVSVLTAEGILYDINSNLPIAKDEALIADLMKLP